MGPLMLMLLALLAGVVLLARAIRRSDKKAQDFAMSEAELNEKIKKFQRGRQGHRLARKRLAELQERGAKRAAESAADEMLRGGKPAA